MACIIVTDGINKGDYHPIKGNVTIGRGSDCQAQLIDKSISRQHVRISPDHDGDGGDRWLVEDLGSANGTDLNGQDLDGKQPLADGDVITIGDSTLRFSTQDFPDKEAAVKHFGQLKWFFEDDRQTYA
jgi:pSer/pThr/pTyr-binding forkhead associated (FHA) protein